MDGSFERQMKWDPPCLPPLLSNGFPPELGELFRYVLKLWSMYSSSLAARNIPHTKFRTLFPTLMISSGCKMCEGILSFWGPFNLCAYCITYLVILNFVLCICWSWMELHFDLGTNRIILSQARMFMQPPTSNMWYIAIPTEKESRQFITT